MGIGSSYGIEGGMAEAIAGAAAADGRLLEKLLLLTLWVKVVPMNPPVEADEADEEAVTAGIFDD